MISLDTFLQIRHKSHNEHQEIPQIARNLGLNKRTVARWASRSEYTFRKAEHRQSKLDSFKPTILELLHSQGLSAKRIYGLIQMGGYSGGYTILRSFVSDKGGAFYTRGLVPR
jgi:DNA-binding transcriptional regulator YiaG